MSLNSSTKTKFFFSALAVVFTVPFCAAAAPFLQFPESSPAPAPQTQAKKAAPQGFALTYNGQAFPVSEQILNSWEGQSQLPKNILTIKPQETLRQSLARLYGQTPPVTKPQETYLYRFDKIYQFIKTAAEKINTPITEPRLVIENDRAKEFTPPQNGQQTDVYQTTLDVLAALKRSQSAVPIIVYETHPQNVLADTNTLGIQEIISRGISNFKGSPSNRRHNIKVGVEKMTGVIIKPGDEFSFNEYLGPVDGEHDFLPELVIKKTGTVPEFGGGLCQVSSTTFRAAMAAGLPITQRRNHAYAVQYYAPQGTDATIYPGVVDLKFKNDTPGSILIWPYFKDKDTLIFDFYGTRDDRQITLEKPTQWDRKEDGSMKAAWKREVTKDGVTLKDEFKSVYLPPALFHKEEQFVSTSTPTTTTPAPTTAQTTSKPQ